MQEAPVADRAYTGSRVAEASPVAVTIVGSAPGQKGFSVQPRHWVVERSSARSTMRWWPGAGCPPAHVALSGLRQMPPVMTMGQAAGPAVLDNGRDGVMLRLATRAQCPAGLS
ncbi:hypothetical protein VQH23_06000 [Pararoseomonas sp. SCSIO 73927]|uniref:hypothetical protein n=1 Tax=Pararoseomonas sp. SCSIO 73927 TaxID=3114537 RepID=UPI0030D1B048